ncbi:MAG: NlpC/P60 family protein [Streptosporangiales bacterium]
MVVLFAASPATPAQAGYDAGLGGTLSGLARQDIPAGYLAWYMSAAQTCPGLPWSVLAGIGKVESDHGRSSLPGVRAESNSAGAEGPMQFLPATFAEAQLGKPYCWGGQGPSCFDCSGLVFAAYAAGGIHIARTTYQWQQDGPQIPLSQVQPGDLLFSAGSDGTPFSGGADCQVAINPSVCPAQMAESGPTVNVAGVVDAGLTAWQRCAAARVVLYAASQLGKPYAWGAAGPDAFDCSGLAMMAYRAAGISIPRTSQEQWAAGPYVPPGQEEPGDLVYFAGSDGTDQDPGHVGIVLGGGLMIDAPYTGADVRVDEIAGAVGFTRPAAAG